MEDLRGAVAVITGGASPRGIGRATGVRLLREGARVVLLDSDAGTLAATIDTLRADGFDDVAGFPCDVASWSDVREVADRVFAELGRVDILFMNAGAGGASRDLLDPDLDGWRRAIDVNVMGVLYGIKAYVPRMLAQGSPGNVVVTSSSAGCFGLLGASPAYSVSKAANCALGELLHAYLDAVDAPIRSTIALPPVVRTNMLPDDAWTGLFASQRREGIPSAVMEPEEMADVVVDAIRRDAPWAHLTHEQAARLTDRDFSAWIDWEDDLVRRRDDALVHRTAPEPYVWGFGG